MTDRGPTSPPRPSPARAARFLPLAVAALLVGVLAYALITPSADNLRGSVHLDKPAPAFTLTSLDGNSVTLADLRGRPVILNFWASWCVPCRQEAPLLRELDERPDAGRVELLGILFQDKDSAARAFMNEFQLKYPTLRDPKLAIAIDYGVAGVPETFFIDTQGVVRHVDRGGLTRERLNEGLEKIGVPAL